MISSFSKYILPVSIISFIIASLLFSRQVLAMGRPQEAGQTNSGSSNSQQGSNSDTMSGTTAGAPKVRFLGPPQQNPTENSTAMSHMPSFAQVHLQDAQLKACQAVSGSIVTRSTHLVGLVTKMEKTFTSIADGVEQYYLSKVVPTGSTLSNYDALVADISTKESTVASLVQTSQTDVASFSCTGNNPAAQLTQYRVDMQAVLKGLQDYRISVKNLIVAVRTLPSVKLSVTPTVTLVPSVTPTVTP